MKTTTLLGGAAALLIGAAGAYWAGTQHRAPPTKAVTAEGSKAADKKVLYWHDPMVPGQKFDQPGKSPFMDMQLVPVYADDAGAEGGVTISPRVQQNLGIRTVEAKEGRLAHAIVAVGNVAYNERDMVAVQARASGYVEQLFVRTPLEPVRRGQALAALYVPDWVAAQEEFLAARRMGGDLADAARQRMRLMGMTEEQVRLVEQTGSVLPRVTITAPAAGIVTELAVREGMTVSAGAPLFRINGMASVWVNAEIPETAAAQVRPGTPVEARSAAWPGVTFKGKVNAVLPEINPTTRTLTARIELANPEGRLVPGMFATVSLAPAPQQAVLLVPSEAVIQTGTRNVVFVEAASGKFTAMDVVTGGEGNGQTEIRQGLNAGQKVVVSGQFLVDSEASLRGTAGRMDAPAPSVPAKPAAATHQGNGRVERIDPDSITLSHGPVASLRWGPMTMPFRAPAGGWPRKFAPGDQVQFTFIQGADGEYQITAITPVAGGKK